MPGARRARTARAGILGEWRDVFSIGPAAVPWTIFRAARRSPGMRHAGSGHQVWVMAERVWRERLGDRKHADRQRTADSSAGSDAYRLIWPGGRAGVGVHAADVFRDNH